VLQTFDAPNGDFACVRRSRSNTPLQALVTLNEPEFFECARSLALTTLRNGGQTDRNRLDHAFRRCVARRPTGAESTALMALLEKQSKRFSEIGRDPWDLLSPGVTERDRPTLPDGTTPAQWAAWTAVSRVLLNLDETITKE
jgi:hypothetical protein